VLRPDAGAGLELRREAGDGRMRFTGPVTFELGRASFRVPSGFSWRLGKANSIAKLAIPAWEELQKGHLKPSIGGLPIGVSPQFELTASDNGGQAKIGVKLELPGMFRTLPSGGEDLFDDGATGGLTLEAVVTASNDNGVSYNVKSKLKKAWFFGLELEDVGFGLDSGPPYTFEGFAKLMLTRERELSLALSLGEGGLLGSSLRKASIQAAKFAVPLGHGVFLQRFGGDMEIGKDPAGNVAPVWSANAGLSFGPRIDLKPFFDGEAVSLDGKIKYTAGAPWVIEASGDAKVVELPLAGASVKYTAGGRWDVAGRIDLTIGGYGVYGEVKDAWATDKGFSVEASGDLRLPGGIATRSETVASTVGFATCQGPANARVGLGQRWGRPAEKMIGVCDVGPYRLAAPSARAAQAPDTPPAFVEIPRGARLFAVELHGRTAPPKPALVGPRGASVATLEGPEPLVSRDATVVQDPVTATTTIVLRDPAPGRWYVVREFGGEPLTHVRTASGRPPVAASAVVRGRGGRRELRWRLRPQPGQKVTFVERGRSGERVLVTTNRRRGALRFRPGTGRRTIEALVTQDGLPRAQRVLARFTGPLAKLRRVARLRLRGRTVLWAGQPAAARYAVALRPRGGTATAHTTRRARFALKKRCRGKLRVSVVALGPDGRVGPRASKTLRCSR